MELWNNGELVRNLDKKLYWILAMNYETQQR